MRFFLCRTRGKATTHESSALINGTKATRTDVLGLLVVAGLLSFLWYSETHRAGLPAMMNVPLGPRLDASEGGSLASRSLKRRPGAVQDIHESEQVMARECHDACEAAGFCCNDFRVGANQYLSCAQACMIRKRGSPAETCKNECEKPQHGCSVAVAGFNYDVCHVCDDLRQDCPYGVMSHKACEYGCAFVDWAWSGPEQGEAPGLLGPPSSLEHAQAVCLQMKPQCLAVTCDSASQNCSPRLSSDIRPNADAVTYRTSP